MRDWLPNVQLEPLLNMRSFYLLRRFVFDGYGFKAKPVIIRIFRDFRLLKRLNMGKKRAQKETDLESSVC